MPSDQCPVGSEGDVFRIRCLAGVLSQKRGHITSLRAKRSNLSDLRDRHGAGAPRDDERSDPRYVTIGSRRYTRHNLVHMLIVT
jgi:hypothetical protein